VPDYKSGTARDDTDQNGNIMAMSELTDKIVTLLYQNQNIKNIQYTTIQNDTIYEKK